MLLLEDRQDMSAIEVDEATEDINRVDASDIETARNCGLEDEMFEPVIEQKMEESSRMQNLNNQMMSGHQDGDIISNEGDSILNEMEDDSVGDLSHDQNPVVQKLRQKLIRADTENIELSKQLTDLNGEINEIKAKNELDEEDNGSSLIPHIKVTLIQFLRNVSLTDRQNEDLLTIIFNMMDFTVIEIQELKIAR